MSYDDTVGGPPQPTLPPNVDAEAYLADRGLATAIYLAMSLKQPLLLEGEAGVGKTEVALRAAAKAAFSGVFVMMVVPTTILADQHYIFFENKWQNMRCSTRERRDEFGLLWEGRILAARVSAVKSIM